MGTIAKITAGGATHAIASSAYGVCDTAASNAGKAVYITVDGDSVPFTLIKGTTIHVKFVNSNTASNPSLNVGGTGAKPITKYGTTAAGTTANTSWSAGAVISFTYDGTSWVMNGHIDNTDTHYTTHLYVGDGTAADKATTNGNTKITVTDNTTVRDSAVIKGTAPLSVVSDASKNITISASNATSSAAGLMSSTDKNHLDALWLAGEIKLFEYTLSAGNTYVESDILDGTVVASYKAYDVSQSAEEVVVDFKYTNEDKARFSIAQAVTYDILIHVLFYTGN